MSPWLALLAALGSLSHSRPVRELRSTVRDLQDIVFPPSPLLPARLRPRAVPEIKLPDPFSGYDLHGHPLIGSTPDTGLLDWGTSRLGTWVRGHLLVYNTTTWSVIDDVPMPAPMALVVDRADRVFWVVVSRPEHREPGGVSLWGFSRAGRVPMRLIHLPIYGDPVHYVQLRAATRGYATDLWAVGDDLPLRRWHVLDGPFPTHWETEHKGSNPEWSLDGAFAADDRRLTLGHGPRGNIVSRAPGRLPAERYFGEWVIDLTPADEPDQVWALFPSRILKLDVGHRRIPIVGGFPYTPKGTPFQISARGGSVALYTTYGVIVFDEAGRVRLPLKPRERLLDGDIALSPDGKQLAVWTPETLTVWDIPSGRARHIYPPK